MEKAIEKAVEGGYEVLPKRAEFRSVEIDHDRWFLNFYDLEGMQSDHFTFTVGGTLLDPLFWQALGKAMRWQEKTDRLIGTEIGFSPPCLTWAYQWHRFIDCLAEGKDAEQFFEELLK